MKRILVLGGYGTFGSLVCRDLARWAVPITVAGRDHARAEAFAKDLGGNSEALAVDLSHRDSLLNALQGHGVAVNCAGPFQSFDTTLLDACLDAGCHYADITDDRGYAAQVRHYGERFQKRGLAAVYGCSSLPGISGALAARLRDTMDSPIARARVTLFIGNRNPKGTAAVASLLGSLGQPIAAPQGTLRVFHDREIVPLPEPFGPRGVFNFETSDYDLLNVPSLSVKVGFESRLANLAFAVLARRGKGYGPWLGRWLKWPGKLWSHFGTSGGAVMVEHFHANGENKKAAIVARTDGQRMAALPCAFVAHALSVRQSVASGAITAYDFLGPEGLIGKLASAGYELIGSSLAVSPPTRSSSGGEEQRCS